MYKKQKLALFVYGFVKNEKDNISTNELKFFKKQAKFILSFNKTKINQAINSGEFIKLETK